jgi:hypothetical protein
MKITPLIHLAISDGIVTDVTALSAIDSFGVKAQVARQGECDVLVYGAPNKKSTLAALQHELGMPKVQESRVSSSGIDSSPYDIQVLDPCSGSGWRRSMGVSWSNRLTTEHKMHCWVAANYLRAAGHIGGNPLGQVARSPRTGAAMAEWYPIYYSTLKGVAEIAARTFIVVLGDASLLADAGISYTPGTIDLLQVIPLKSIIKEFTTSYSEEYQEEFLTKNIPRSVMTSSYGDAHGRTMEGSLQALKLLPASFDTMYYEADTVADALMLGHRLWAITDSGSLMGPSLPHQDLTTLEACRLLNILAMSYDPVIDLVSLVCPTAYVGNTSYPRGRSQLWNRIKGTPGAATLQRSLKKNMTLFSLFNRTYKQNKDILFRTTGHTKLAERKYREYLRDKLESTKAFSLEGFDALHTQWARPLANLIGEPGLPYSSFTATYSGTTRPWNWYVSVIYYFVRTDDLTNLLEAYCSLVYAYSQRPLRYTRAVTGFSGATVPLASTSKVSPYVFGEEESFLPRPDIGLHMQEILNQQHGTVCLTDATRERVEGTLSNILDGSVHNKLRTEMGGEFLDIYCILIHLKDNGYF